MLKWLASLFKGRNGPVPEGELVTRKNVDQHTQKIVMDFRRLNTQLDELVPSPESETTAAD